MENKINIAELLKDCPQGMELDCTMYDNITLFGISEGSAFPINIKRKDGLIYGLTKYGQATNYEDAKCIIFPKGKTTWEGFVPPCKFKDGDVLVHTQNDRFVMSIYKSNESETIINTYTIFWDRGEGLSVGMQICCYTDSTRLATEEEKQKLFDAIKDNGYRWNTETKTLEKLVSNKFDISTLKPFDKVLVRDRNIDKWRSNFWEFYDTDNTTYPYVCCGNLYSKCIPYEGNEHLLGSINDCDEYYKTWK